MLATHGDHRLGGRELDYLSLISREEFDRAHGENRLLIFSLSFAKPALAAKIQLSRRPRTAIVHNPTAELKVEFLPGIRVQTGISREGKRL